MFLICYSSNVIMFKMLRFIIKFKSLWKSKSIYIIYFDTEFTLFSSCCFTYLNSVICVSFWQKTSTFALNAVVVIQITDFVLFLCHLHMIIQNIIANYVILRRIPVTMEGRRGEEVWWIGATKGTGDPSYLKFLMFMQ